MRKHFLLLFLMALLPLAGWAQTEYTALVNAKAYSITYGEANPAADEVDDDMFTANISGTGAAVSSAVKTLIAGKLAFSTERTATSPVDGSYTFTLAVADPLDVTVTDGSDTYVISLQSASNSLVVNKANTAAIAVTPTANNATLTYDQETKDLLSSTKGSGKITGTEITGLVLEYAAVAHDAAAPDDEDYSDTGYNVTDAGTYDLYYRVKETANYNASAAAKIQNITVNKGTPVITLPTLSANVTYNGLPRPVATGDGNATLGAVVTYKVLKYNATTDAWENGATATDASTLQVTDAGLYKIKAKTAETTNLNEVGYQTTETVFEIAKAPLTIAIKAGQSKEYSTAVDPNLEYTYTGLQNNEDPATLIGAGDLTVSGMTRVTGENAGVYPITIDDENGFTAKNYAITVDPTSRNFAITSKALAEDGFTFTVNSSADVTYTGEDVEPGLEAAKFGSTDLVENTDYTLSYSNNINVGTNTAVMTITGKGNFKGTLTRNFDITKAEIYIIPEAKSKTYGGSEPSFTYTLKDANGDAVDNSALKGSVILKRVAGENVGTYKIYVESYTAGAGDNYQTTAQSATFGLANVDNASAKTALLTINAPATGLVLQFKSTATKTKVYGNDNPAWTIDDLEPIAEGSGLVATDNWDDVKASLGTPVFTLGSATVGTTTVSVSNLASPVYPSVTVNQMTDFEITARPITVTLVDQEINYGATLGQAYTTNWTISGGTLATGDTEAGLGLIVKTVNDQATYAVSATPYADAITAEISNTNYSLETVKGKLTVNDAAAIELFRSTTGADASKNAAKIAAYAGLKPTVNIKGDELKAGFWYTLVLPFAAKVRDISSAFGYAVVDVPDLTTSTAKEISFKLKVDGQAVPANTLMLIKIDEDRNLTTNAAVFNLNTLNTAIVNNGANVLVDQAGGASAGNEYYVTYDAKTLSTAADGGFANCWYLNEDAEKIVADPTKNKFYRVGALASVPQDTYTVTALGGYFKAYSAGLARVYVQEADGTITAINAAEIDVKAQNAEGWYNLNGVKLNAAPTQKGVYIQNGKKVIVK